ncbi:hypothetical protein CN918_29780 [Priestia megaterium]|nr:hypothetical protein CN918_29780 [Priestia megaterium]
MKTIMLTVLITLSSLVFGEDMKAYALAIPQLPVSEKSAQWSVEVTKADEDDPHLMQAAKGSHHVYSLNVKNIGQDVNDATIQLFRNEPHSKTKYGLLQTDEPCHLSKTGEANFHIFNFGLSEEATDLNVTITWVDTKSGQQLQETFIFHQK